MDADTFWLIIAVVLFWLSGFLTGMYVFSTGTKEEAVVE